MSSPALLLALFGAVPWRGVPVMPVEIMLLPRWFPFHSTKSPTGRARFSCRSWSLIALKPQASNPRNVTIAELSSCRRTRCAIGPAGRIKDCPGQTIFAGLDRFCARSSRFFRSACAGARSIRRVAFVRSD